MLCNGIAASWKMALILETWLGVAEVRERAEVGIRFLLLFEMERRGVWGDAILVDMRILLMGAGVWMRV